jgi:alpha-glucosidase
MLGVLRFWLDRGVAGFRVDALRQVLKDPEWRDNPPNPDYRPGQQEYESLLPIRSADHDDLAPVRAMAETIAERGGVMVGELYLPFERLVRYYAAGVQMPSNMHLISTPWEPRALASLIEEYEAALPEGAWPNWVLGNHDRSRVASRVGAAQARVAAMLLFTLRGTPTLYYGDELGMTDVEIPPELVADPWEEAGRDPVRTPMPWSADGGFTSGEPWLPMGDPAINAAAQRDDPRSMLVLHRELIALRQEFVDEPYETLSVDDATLVYRRGPFVVALNLSGAPAERPPGRVRLSTELDGGADVLRPNEGVVVSP